jgi:hypothetical protein
MMAMNEEQQYEHAKWLHRQAHDIIGDDKPLCEACGGTGYAQFHTSLEQLKATAAKAGVDLGGNPLPKTEHRETFVPYQQVCQVCSSRDHVPTPPVVPDIYLRFGKARGSCPSCHAEMGALPETEQVRMTYENQLLREHSTIINVDEYRAIT